MTDQDYETPQLDPESLKPRNEWPEAVQTIAVFSFLGWIAWLVSNYKHC